MASSTESPKSPFTTKYYSSSLGAKIVRALGAGPSYYLQALPRYLARRRQLGLGWDPAAWITPLKEFRPARHHHLPKPPQYDEALALVAGAGVSLALPAMRFEAVASVWWSVRQVPGEVIECGAFEGATALTLAVLGKLHRLEQKVLVLDTFAGTPDGGSDDLLRQGGEFESAPDQVEVIRRQAARLGVDDRIEIHAGLFADTFRHLAATELELAFAHIDANVYEGTYQACEFVLPRIRSGGAVVFDDYGSPFDLGARLAIDRYFHDRPEKPRPLAWCAAYLEVE